MNLAPFHTLIVTLHVLGVITFVLAHGVSAFVLLRIRSERDPAALRTLLGLSRQSFGVMSIGFLTWFVAGIAAGFSGNWWTSGTYWIWVSLLIAVVLTGVMTPFGRIYFNRIRETLGIDPKTGAYSADFQPDAEAVNSAIASGKPELVAVLGVGGLLILGWLMVAKPF
jgi:small-conductance mechanosensitive channel